MTESALIDDVMLLALDEARGTVPAAVRRRLDCALRGAIVMELALRGRIRLDGDDAIVADPAPTGDELLDEARAGLGGRRARGIQHLVRALPVKKLRERVLQRLVTAGALAHQRRRILGVIPADRYPVWDGARRAALAGTIQDAVLGEGSVDGATAARVGLVRAAGALGRLFPREERREAERRAARLTAGDLVGEAVDRTIAAMNAAVIASVVAATVAATSGGAATTSTS